MYKVQVLHRSGEWRNAPIQGYVSLRYAVDFAHAIEYRGYQAARVVKA